MTATYKQKMHVKGNTTTHTLPCTQRIDLLAVQAHDLAHLQALTDRARITSDVEATKRYGAPARDFYVAAMEDPARQARFQARREAAEAVLNRVTAGEVAWGRSRPITVGKEAR